MPYPLPALIVLAGVFFALWLHQQRTRNASLVDVAWAYGTGAMGVTLALASTGAWPRQALAGGLIALWSFRLGTHILRRVRGKPEDSRYRALREGAGARAGAVMFAVFAMNALLVLAFSLPAGLAAGVPVPGLRWIDWLGLLIGLGAVAGEALADAQLRNFARNPANKGLVCRDGLWRYSRHPNYFFEWLFWFAFVCAAWGSPHWAWSLLAPALMLFFLLKFTGIPATEAQSLRSRGEAYRAYQRETSAFIPWFPKRGA